MIQMLLNSHIKTEVNKLVNQQELKITEKKVTLLINI